jgi:hypothetical protein
VASRHLRGWLGLACTLLAVVELADTGALLAKAADRSSEVILNLRLTPTSALPAISRRALVGEAGAIWRQGRIQLRWLNHDEGPPAGAELRVLITPHAVSSTSETGSWSVGELLRFDDSVAIAVASMSGATRIVDVSRRMSVGEPADMRDYRLGVVLGRAIAHEIGHYVLQTNTHASTGLMRGTIEAHEFADLQTDAFHLDPATRAHVAAAAAAGPDQSLLPDRPFSYRPRYPSRRGSD